MKSILDNRPELAKEVNKVAEVAGYLWQKGWAERNGGNITVNITEYVDDEIRQMPAISEVKQIGVTLPHLKGCYFYCKGTNMRMRDLARWPMDNGSVIRILDDCASYVIIADKPVQPTSEVPSHLSVHNYLISIGSPYKASVHTHPIELIALSHNKKFMEKDVATNQSTACWASPGRCPSCWGTTSALQSRLCWPASGRAGTPPGLRWPTAASISPEAC